MTNAATKAGTTDRLEDRGEAQSLFKPGGEREHVGVQVTWGVRRNAPSQNFGGRNADGLQLAVPAARRLARENGLDLAAVSGSGPGGRVRLADVQRALQRSAVEAGVGNRSPVPAEYGVANVECELDLSAMARLGRGRPEVEFIILAALGRAVLAAVQGMPSLASLGLTGGGLRLTRAGGRSIFLARGEQASVITLARRLEGALTEGEQLAATISVIEIEAGPHSLVTPTPGELRVTYQLLDALGRARLFVATALNCTPENAVDLTDQVRALMEDPTLLLLQG